jgi:hypothetical protein
LLDVRAFILCSLSSSLTDVPTGVQLISEKLIDIAVMSSTAAATLRQLVIFVVNKVVEEDRCMLLSNELESITLLNRLTQVLGPAVCDAFAIFEDRCLLGNVLGNVRNSNTSTRCLLSS